MPTDDPDSTASLLADIDQEGRRWRGPHPSTEKLAAYRASRLPAAEEVPVQQHLVLCERCQQRLLDYAAFDDDVTAQAESDGAALGSAPAGAWESLSARLAADRAAAPGRPEAAAAGAEEVPHGRPAAVAAEPQVPQAPAEPVQTVPPRAVVVPIAGRDAARTLVRYRGAVIALAAALVLCCVALPWWLGGRLPAAVGVGVSGPGEITRGSENTIRVRLNTQGMAAVLSFQPEHPSAAYKVDVYRQGGERVLTANCSPTRVTMTGTRANGAGPGEPAPAEWLIVPLSGLPVGNYQARVYGQDGEPGEVVAESTLQVIP